MGVIMGIRESSRERMGNGMDWGNRREVVWFVVVRGNEMEMVVGERQSKRIRVGLD